MDPWAQHQETGSSSATCQSCGLQKAVCFLLGLVVIWGPVIEVWGCGEIQVRMKVKVLVAHSSPTLCDPTNCSPPGPSVHGFSQQEYWRGLPFPSPGNLPDPGMEPGSLASPAWAGRFFTTAPPGKHRSIFYHKKNVIEAKILVLFLFPPYS